MSFPDKTPELPKFRRLTSGAMLQKRIGGLWTLRLSEGAEGSILAEGPNAQPGSASVPNGHSQPLQPLRRRLPPERLPEIGELLKNIGLDEADEEKENQPVKESAIESIARREMPPPQNSAKPFEMAATPRLGFVEPEKPTMRMFAPMSKVLKVNGKDYMIIGGLGSGGSCEVYSALHEGQIVAIKDVTLPKEAAVKENYLREIQMLKKLSDCEQVVRLLDYEEGDGKILMVMEKGDSDLSAVLQRASKDWITVRFFWRDMLRAVERIHKLGIIHQDLKPANFIIVKGRLKLIDFGISDDIGDATSVFRDCAIGTFNYMSPEIIQQSRESSIKTSRASDIWSLGCILYSLAFGEPPFAHIKNMNNKVLAIVNPKHEISYPADADPDLLDVLKRCLRRQPKERATAEELLKHDFVLGPPSIRSTYKNK
ncbi:dual specificity protein kinase TTK-like [Varroa jacobsoni]|uniref:Protein kinase domain-containing protein n=1 Tax=Varroa destructor TaxID=109461 RepID=A0A7M7J856_VARDE|nr:dual specificity protein kinase TTK-like [Varroa destructor]XP_022696233.1 dual specificity protein kinase TTK-like [Varroa jacobsoni]